MKRSSPSAARPPPAPVEQLRFRERDGKPSAYTRLYAQGVDLLVHKDQVYQQFGLHKSPPAPALQASTRQRAASSSLATSGHISRSSVVVSNGTAPRASSASASIRHRSSTTATSRTSTAASRAAMTPRQRSSSGGGFQSSRHQQPQRTSASSSSTSGVKKTTGRGAATASRPKAAPATSSAVAAKPQRRQSAIATQLLSKTLKIGPAMLHTVSSTAVFPASQFPAVSARSPRLSMTPGSSLQQRPSGHPVGSPTAAHHQQQQMQLNRRQSFQVAASTRTTAPPPQPRSLGKPGSPVRGAAEPPPPAVLVPVSRRTSSPLVAPNVTDFGGMRRRPSVSPIRGGTAHSSSSSSAGGGGDDSSSGTAPAPRPSVAFLQRRDSKMDRLVEQITVLKNSLGLSDEDLQWKVESTKGNAYEAADRHLREAEELYDRLVYETQLLSETPCDEASAVLVKRLRELVKQNQLVMELKPALAARQADAAQRKKEVLEARIASELRVAKGGGDDYDNDDDDELAHAQQRLDAAKQSILQTQNLIKDEMTKLNELLLALGKETDALAAACARFKFLSPDAADASAAFLNILRCVPECGGDKLVALCEQGVLTAQRFTGSKARELKRKEAEMDKALRDIEVWKSRKEQSKEFAQEMAKRERQWKLAQHARNAESLRLLRSLVPLDIQQITTEALVERARDSGGVLYTYDLALYIKQNKLLHWLVTHESDIARDNFLAVECASWFLNFTSYDIHELRAVCHVLPEAFDFDKDGKKAEWKRQLMEHVRLLVKQQGGETIKAGWDPARGARADVPLKPLSERQLLNAVYRYPTEDEIRARIDKFELQLTRLRQKRDKMQTLETVEIPAAKSEYLAIAEDARSEELQQVFGKATLIKLRDDAKQSLQALTKARDALKSEIDHAERQWNAQTPSYEQFLAEAARIRALDAETRAARIRGPFPGELELKPRERAAFKKLSVEEEAQARRLELSKAIADRDKGLVDESAGVAAAAATAAIAAEEASTTAVVREVLASLVEDVATTGGEPAEAANAADPSISGRESDVPAPSAASAAIDGGAGEVTSASASVASTAPPAENAAFRRIKSLRVSTEVLRFLQNDFCSPRRTKSNTTLPISEILGPKPTAPAATRDATATSSGDQQSAAAAPPLVIQRRRPSLSKPGDDKADPTTRATPRAGSGTTSTTVGPRASVPPSEQPKPKSKALLALLEKQQQQAERANDTPTSESAEDASAKPAGMKLDFLSELKRKAAKGGAAGSSSSSQPSRPAMAKAGGQLDLFSELKSRANTNHVNSADSDSNEQSTPETATKDAPRKMNFLEELAMRAKNKARATPDGNVDATAVPPPPPVVVPAPRSFLDELKAKAMKKPSE